ncbi:MAG: NADH-quinone oxidoreductase subunit NuoN [Gammaproteobacteria bacterium]|nr:NADH-quinone oxidoreductase subunit NuoN [Gammaproteobacteria bacterium]
MYLSTFFANATPALPEIALLSMTCIVLLADLFFSRLCPRIPYYLTQLALLGVICLSLCALNKPQTSAFFGMFMADPLSSLLNVFICLTSLFSFLYARSFLEETKMPLGEYYTLGLFSVLGMMLMVSSQNFLPLFLGLELQSLPLYAMIALRRSSGIASEAAMKYFIMGSLASAMLLYGISLLYGVTHSLSISEAAIIFSQGTATHNTVFACALVFIIAGIAFKFGAAPFHAWAPDVYQGAPSIVTLFLGSAPKIAMLGFTFKFLVQAMPTLQTQWQLFFIILAVLSMALGNIVAVVQTNFKRMLAYSSISHMGYMLLGLISGTQAGYAAATFYIIAYAFMTLAGFAMIALLSKAGVEAESIKDFQGLNYKHPWLAFLVMVVMFSMAGVPPTIGFFAKLSVLQALVQVDLVWLAALALIFSVIGAYYYIAVIKTMYFDQPEKSTPFPTLPLDATIAISVNGLLLLILGLFPSGLIELCNKVFL